MALDDIYQSKATYERFIAELDTLCEKPKPNGHKKYYCKNIENVVYFRHLLRHFDTHDISYVRRNKMLLVMRNITYVTEKNLKDCDRDDIDGIVAFGHSTYKTVVSKRDFIKDVKCIWRILFPERDSRGRIDATITPYAVRHLTRKVPRSLEKLRNDRLTWEEFQRIVEFFAREVRIQAYLMLAMESLGRPQEILYTKIKDYEFHDSWAKVWISEHGKEGTGFLQCIDSYPYVMEWYRQHPFKSNPDAFFFINLGKRGQYQQLKNLNINKQLRQACKALGIDKNPTCYSLKRNGVTFRRYRGDSDLQIQHAARWTSTKQLQIYDLSTHQDALNIELQKRGITNKADEVESKTKFCTFCSSLNGFTAEFCVTCKRPLDRKKIEEMARVHEQVMNNEMMQRLNKMEQLFKNMLAKA